MHSKKFLIILIIIVFLFLLLSYFFLMPLVNDGDSHGLATSHPRLYFSSEDIPSLRIKSQEESDLWYKIQSTAESVMLPKNVDAEKGDDSFETLAALRYPAFFYAITGDEQMGAKGKQYLLDVCGWSTWVKSAQRQYGHRFGYTTGQVAIGVAEAYDWLYPLLTEEERQIVRDAIIEKALEPAHVYYTSGAYQNDKSTNRAAQGMGGAGVAALAIMYDQNYSHYNEYVASISQAMQEYFDAYDIQGGWHEGVIYQSFSLCAGSGALYYAEASKRITGLNYYGYKGFQNAMIFPLYLLPPDREGATDSFGDGSFNEGFASCAVARYVSEYENGYAQWYYNKASPSRWDMIPEFLWLDRSITEKTPQTLSSSLLFPDIGWMVMRTGWQWEDTLLVFRSGPIFTDHNRPEQNSFTLDALGERLIISPGLSSKGYADPAIEYYNLQTISQNTILIDDNPESQLNRYDDVSGISSGGMAKEHFISNYTIWIVGSASNVYRGKLAKFNRQIVFMNPDYFVVYDDLASATKPVRFISLLHTLGTDSISVKNDMITITQNEVKLYTKILYPRPFVFEIRKGYPVFFDGFDHSTSYIEVSPSTKTTTSRFLMVLYPIKGTGSPPTIIPIEGNGVLGAQVQRESGIDVIAFATGDREISVGEIACDGTTCIVSQDAEIISGYAIGNGTVLRSGGKILFSSPSKASISLRFSNKKIEGVAQLEKEAKIQFFSVKPSNMKINGYSRSYYFDERTSLLSITLQSGTSKMEIIPA